ncbi:hypothetical protein BDP27DRAFT_1420634 [Rhodocollybia butyracea]|uniref:Uncharacterized protein n=1 Tax=Rhodocollybia butyracea TaxID=206335 RepID=A0A9P5PX70_9AGAR|nr:hypothetical protein BDP27DRAFT_1420634 [Rhodocollybia butyracea]
MVTAVLMRHYNGPVNDRLWTIGVVMMVQQFLNSIVEWIDNRNRENRLHDVMKKRSALLGTNSGGSMSSAQVSSTGLINFAVAKHGQIGQDGEADIVVTDPSATTSTNTPSPTLIPSIPSTCSSASLPSPDKSWLFSQTEKFTARSRNQESVETTETNSALEIQQQGPVLTERNMNVAPWTTGASLLVEAKGTNTTPVAIKPSTSVEKDTETCTKGTVPVSASIGPSITAISDDSLYNNQIDLGQSGMTIHDNSWKTSAISPILVASLTLLGPPDSVSAVFSSLGGETAIAPYH